MAVIAMTDVVAERRRERERLIGLARGYVHQLSSRVSIRAAVVVGSVARGDFNVWSDVDVIVVADELPRRTPERTMLLSQDAPPGLQAVGFTPQEFQQARRRSNRMALEATERGVVLEGRTFLGSFGGPA